MTKLQKKPISLLDAMEPLEPGSLNIFYIECLQSGNFNFKHKPFTLFLLEKKNGYDVLMSKNNLKVLFYDVENNLKLYIKELHGSSNWYCPHDVEIYSDNGHFGYINLIQYEKI